MVTTLDDKKRLAIAEKLADMKAIQNLIISEVTASTFKLC